MTIKSDFDRLDEVYRDTARLSRWLARENRRTAINDQFPEPHGIDPMARHYERKQGDRPC